MSFIPIIAIIVLALGAVGYIAYRLMYNSDGAVPVTGYDEIQQAKMEFLAQQKQQRKSGASQAAFAHDVDYKETATLKDKIMTLEDENAKLGVQVSNLQRENSALTKVKESLKESQSLTESLKKENEALNKKLTDQEEKFKELNENIEKISSELESAKSQESLGQEIWEKEIAELKAEKEQLLVARYELDELKKQNFFYEDQESKVKNKYKRLAERFVALRRRVKAEEKAGLDKIDQLENTNRILESKIVLMEQEKANLVDEMERLKERSESPARLDNLGDVFGSREDAGGSQGGPSIQNDLMQKDYEKIKELNEHLLEKERILQYELTKSRAHSLGLEKVCEGLAEKIENYNL